MSEFDDLEEINLSPERSGSARRIRAGIKHRAAALARANEKSPLWQRQLRSDAAALARKAKQE